MISIVIPNFNGGKLLEKNLPKLLALLKKSGLEYEVILADDCSTDDSARIAEKFGLKIVRQEKNSGFATNIDAGIRAAKGEIIFTIKTDSIPESSDYFKLLLQHFDNSKAMPAGRQVFAVSAALKTIEKGIEEIRGNGEIYFEKGFFLHRRGSNFSKTSAWADGSASAWRKDLYLKIGGFDPLYNPFYWEDTDLGYRAWKAGYRIDFEPRAILLHNYESGAIAKYYTKRQIKLISLRNQFIFARKNTDLKHRLLYVIWQPYHFLVALKNRDWLFFEAWWQAILQCPGILIARIRQNKVNKLSDDRVLKLFGSRV